jgi:hypothetical protein
MAAAAAGHLGHGVFPKRLFLQGAFGVCDDDLIVLQEMVHDLRTQPVLRAAGSVADAVGRKVMGTALKFSAGAEKSVFAQ